MYEFACYNGGTCEVTDLGKPTCLCPFGIAGRQCETSKFA